MASWSDAYESGMATGRRVWSAKGTPVEERLKTSTSTAKRRERRNREQFFLESLSKKVDVMQNNIEHILESLSKPMEQKNSNYTVYVPGEVQFVEVPIVQIVYKTIEIPVYDVVVQQQRQEDPKLLQGDWQPLDEGSKCDESDCNEKIEALSSSGTHGAETQEEKDVRQGARIWRGSLGRPVTKGEDSKLDEGCNSETDIQRSSSGFTRNDAETWKGKRVLISFYDNGAESKLEYYNQEPLGCLIDHYCQKHHISRSRTSFQVWENDINDQETWLQVCKEHPEDDDLFIDVVREL